jgi:hypothetical protein
LVCSGTMKTPPPSPYDQRRREVLRQNDLLDTVPEKASDDLTALAAHIHNIPPALVPLVILDRAGRVPAPRDYHPHWGLNE